MVRRPMTGRYKEGAGNGQMRAGGVGKPTRERGRRHGRTRTGTGTRRQGQKGRQGQQGRKDAGAGGGVAPGGFQGWARSRAILPA